MFRPKKQPQHRYKDTTTALAAFKKCIAEAKEIDHMNEYIGYANSDYIEKYAYASLDEVNLHIELLENMIKLQKAINNPAYNPTQLPEVSESKDIKIRAAAEAFFPAIQQSLHDAARAMNPKSYTDNVYMDSDLRFEVIKFISKSLQLTTEIVEDQFKDPAKIKPLLKHLNTLSSKKENALTAWVRDYPREAGTWVLCTGLIMAFTGIVISAVPVVGMMIGIPIIAAGLALVLKGMALDEKANKVADPWRQTFKESMSFQEKFKARITSMTEAIKIADKAVNKAIANENKLKKASTSRQPLHRPSF